MLKEVNPQMVDPQMAMPIPKADISKVSINSWFSSHCSLQFQSRSYRKSPCLAVKHSSLLHQHSSGKNLTGSHIDLWTSAGWTTSAPLIYLWLFLVEYKSFRRAFVGLFESFYSSDRQAGNFPTWVDGRLADESAHFGLSHLFIFPNAKFGSVEWWLTLIKTHSYYYT